MKQLDITTGLDLVGLGLVAGGSAAGLWHWIHGFSLIVAGITLVGGSWVAARASK